MARYVWLGSLVIWHVRVLVTVLEGWTKYFLNTWSPRDVLALLIVMFVVTKYVSHGFRFIVFCNYAWWLSFLIAKLLDCSDLSFECGFSHNWRAFSAYGPLCLTGFSGYLTCSSLSYSFWRAELNTLLIHGHPRDVLALLAVMFVATKYVSHGFRFVMYQHSYIAFISFRPCLQ